MKKAQIWVKDEVWMTITGLESADSTFLWNYFGIEVEGSWYMPARKLGRWDGKIRFFDKNGRIYLRLLEEVLPFLEKWGYEIELKDDRRPVPLITSQATENMFDGKSQVPIKIRPYQLEAVNTALATGSGIILAATSSGKTIMCAALCEALGRHDIRCLLIVPSADLVDQTVNTFKLAGVDVGTYSGSKKDLAHQHIVATWQALQNQMHIVSNSSAPGIDLEHRGFNCLIVDECHGAVAKVLGELINNHGQHIPYRFGLTGTLPTPKTDVYTIRGSLGEVIYEISAATLMAQGYLAQVEIQPVEIQEIAEEDFPDYTSEKAYVSRQPNRLDFIADYIIDRANVHGNTLVLVNNVKQGQQLQKLIKDSVFLYGATENDVRAEWYSTFADRDDLIVIATFGIASTGISIDRIFCLFMIDAGKSAIRTIQSIGRSLRKGHDKDNAKVYDVYSSLKWGKKHARERVKYYKKASYPVLKPIKAKLA